MAYLYGISDDLERLTLYAKCGAKFAQYRSEHMMLELESVLSLREKTNLVINNSLEVAELLGVWGAHLGQSDLKRYGSEALGSRRCKVGISAHTDSEVREALLYNPDYLAFGPVFETATKDLPYPPCGPEKLREVVASVNVPVVAIGGISPDNVKVIAGTGAAGAASIGALAAMGQGEISRFCAMAGG